MGEWDRGKKVRRTEKNDAEEQRRLHEAAAKCIGVWKGPGRTADNATVRKVIRKRLRGEIWPLKHLCPRVERVIRSIDGLFDDLSN